MVPVGTLAFFATGILFAGFSFTLLALFGKQLAGAVNTFAYAFLTLALAFSLWGIVTYLNNPTLLSWSIIAGDGLILLGTLFLLLFLLRNIPSFKGIAFVLWIIFSGAFLWWRTAFYPPNPAVISEILHFNTPIPVSAVLGLLITAIWLPAGLVASKLTAGFGGFYLFNAVLYAFATIAGAVLLTAIDANTIVLAVILLAITFGTLLLGNLLAVLAKRE